VSILQIQGIFSSHELTVYSLKGDVSDKADVERLAKEMAEKEPKGIHILVNNA
jgi:NAD(P)-dependent dehydrogenase (short-subunit alcohol dehydrogenase family)